MAVRYCCATCMLRRHERCVRVYVYMCDVGPGIGRLLRKVLWLCKIRLLYGGKPVHVFCRPDVVSRDDIRYSVRAAPDGCECEIVVVCAAIFMSAILYLTIYC